MEEQPQSTIDTQETPTIGIPAPDLRMTWSKAWPTTSGVFWFHGKRTHFDLSPSTFLAKVFAHGDEIAISAGGAMLETEKGAFGLWCPATVPGPPSAALFEEVEIEAAVNVKSQKLEENRVGGETVYRGDDPWLDDDELHVFTEKEPLLGKVAWAPIKLPVSFKEIDTENMNAVIQEIELDAEETDHGVINVAEGRFAVFFPNPTRKDSQIRVYYEPV